MSPTQAGFADYLDDFNKVFDRNQWHWTYWSNDQGGWSPLNADRSETLILQYLVRTFPKATAGKIESFSFDALTKKFEMTFTSNASISQPTEIFVPNRFYPNGYNVVVSGTTNYTKETDATKQLVKIKVNESKEVTIEIVPK